MSMWVQTHVSSLWREADAVCFDVDSTVTMEEGIDKLAERAGKGEEVARLTKQAMGGDMSFRRALDLRLTAIQPTKDLVQKVAAEPVPLTPGIEQLVHRLQELGKEVFLVSGGFRSMIQPVAEQLNIRADHIFANELLFDEVGAYAGFSHEEPTSDSGGKARAVTEIMRRFSLNKVVMVGDGATDMEAKPPARLTIGFGGNVVRENVKMLADLYIYDFQELISMLISPEECESTNCRETSSPLRTRDAKAKAKSCKAFKDSLAQPKLDLVMDDASTITAQSSDSEDFNGSEVSTPAASDITTSCEFTPSPKDGWFFEEKLRAEAGNSKITLRRDPDVSFKFSCSTHLAKVSVTNVTALLNKSEGRDKMARFFQYAARAVMGLTTMTRPQAGTRIHEASEISAHVMRQLAGARRTHRWCKELPVIQNLSQTIAKAVPASMTFSSAIDLFLDLMQKVNLSMFLVIDHVGWLKQVKLLRGGKRSGTGTIQLGLKFFCASNFIGMLLQAKKLREIKTNTEDHATNQRKCAENLLKHALLVVQTAHLSRAYESHDVLVGVFGMITSAMDVLSQWPEK